MTPHGYLINVLNKQKLQDSDLTPLQNAREDIERKLRQYIGWSPRFYYGGSYGKRTMIKASYDLDIAAYFPMDDGRPIRDIYNLVHQALLNSGFLVHPKTVALNIPYSNHGFYIDVVPARARDLECRDATLYKNGHDSYMKTSLKVHIESVRPYREIIKLMKLWKVRHGISCKTFVIEQLVRRAIGNQLITDYSDAMKRVLEFIANNIKIVRLVDPANSNNIIDLEGSTRNILQAKASISIQQRYWEYIVW